MLFYDLSSNFEVEPDVETLDRYESPQEYGKKT